MNQTVIVAQAVADLTGIEVMANLKTMTEVTIHRVVSLEMLMANTHVHDVVVDIGAVLIVTLAQEVYQTNLNQILFHR